MKMNKIILNYTVVLLLSMYGISMIYAGKDWSNNIIRQIINLKEYQVTIFTNKSKDIKVHEEEIIYGKIIEEIPTVNINIGKLCNST